MKRLKQKESERWSATLVVRKECLAPNDQAVRTSLYPNGPAAKRFIRNNMKRGLFSRGWVVNQYGMKVYEVKR